MGIRDSGFGLNYDQGFGSRGGYTLQSYDPNAIKPLLGQQQAFVNQKKLGEQQYGQSWALQGQQLAQRDREAALRHGEAMAGINAQLQTAGINARAQTYPAVLKQQRWNQLFPMVGGLMGGGGQFGSSYQGNGQVGTQPTISDAPVYSPQQVQQQVNAQRAQNDQRAASQTREMQGQMAGRGYGAGSPLAMAMQQGYQNQALAASSDMERQLRLDAAGANAGHVLDAQKAKETQFANRQGEDIERNKVRTGLLSGILGSMFGAI